jgi:hypothetical protein
MNEFVTKDSGERQQFTSGMQRDTQKGKTLFHLVYDGPLFKRWAELLTRGAEKYSEGNWMKANGPEELKRFKASAARHFAQWYYDETDEDHAAAVIFNMNGAEFVKGKIRVENIARIDKVNKAQPEEVSVSEYEDRVHARQTQERFNSPLFDETFINDEPAVFTSRFPGEDENATTPYVELDDPSVETQDALRKFLTVEESRAIADKVLYGLGEMKVGIDFAKEDSDRFVYLVGEPGKQVFVVPEDLREEFEKATIARNNERVPVNEDTLNLLRFNGFPLIYTPNLGASPLDPKPAFNGVTTTYRFDIPNKPTPFLDLVRQRVFEAQLDLAERYERSIWSVPNFAGSCSGDPPFNFIQRLLIKLQDLYQDLKSLVAKKLYDAAVGLDPEVTYEDVEA